MKEKKHIYIFCLSKDNSVEFFRTLLYFVGVKIMCRVGGWQLKNSMSVWAWAPESGLKGAELLSGLNNEEANSKQAWWCIIILRQAPSMEEQPC